MIATWTRDLPRETEADRRGIVSLADDLGIDTVITPDPTPAMADEGETRGVDVLDVVSATVSAAFRETHPDALQRMRPAEKALATTLANYSAYDSRRDAYRWYPPVHAGDWLCLANPDARELLRRRIDEALETAHGVALDAFGYRNHYACFCDRCTARRDGGAPLAADAEEVLVDVSEELYDHAKSVDPDSVVTNHVWPPFRPNTGYSHRLHLDYDSPTIAWYYRPFPSLDRVEFEAATQADRHDPDQCGFAPFVGVRSDPELTREPERIRRELEIALEYGGGDVVFSRLETAARHDDIARVLRDVLG